jgi:hypothetical protein
MTLSTRNAVAAILVVMLARPAPIRAQETGSASAEDTASAQAPSATEDAGPPPEADLVEFAKTLPMFWPDKRKSMAGEAMVFDVERGTRLRWLRRYGDTLRHVRFSPDCTLALLSLYDKCLLWNLGNGDVVREFEQGGIAHFSPDGSSILIYGEYQATRYEVATGEVIETLQLPTFGCFKNRHTRINAHLDNEVYHDASGTLVYAANGSGVQPIVNAATAEQVGRCPSNTRWCLVSGASKTVVQGGPLHPINVVRVFDFDENEIARFDMPVEEGDGRTGQLKAVSRDGGRFLHAVPVGGGGRNPGPHARSHVGRYSIHDATTGEKIKVLGDFDLECNATFSPDARRVVLVPAFGWHDDDPRDPEILVIDSATGAVERRMYSGPWALPSSEFSADGSLLIVAGAIDVHHWRFLAGWRQWERQNPMPRKVADTLKIFRDRLEQDGRGQDAAAPGLAPGRAAKDSEP